MDVAVGEDGGGTRWLILVYHLPREPSRHRVAAWRKLKALGALYLQDGVARERLQLRVTIRAARLAFGEGADPAAKRGAG